MERLMQPEVLARLDAIARGEIVSQLGGTGGTGGTLKVVPPKKGPSFHAFHVFHFENQKRETTQFGGGTVGGTGRPIDDVDVAAMVDAGRFLQSPFWATLTALKSKCPALIELQRWRQAVADSKCFLARWDTQAGGLGWTARDLFGLHAVPDNPPPNYRRLSRYDETGLIWLLQGRPVVMLTDATAAIENPSGTVTVYRKYRKPSLGPVGDSLDDFR
jgi:hypothetical protein